MNHILLFALLIAKGTEAQSDLTKATCEYFSDSGPNLADVRYQNLFVLLASGRYRDPQLCLHLPLCMATASEKYNGMYCSSEETHS